MWRAKSLHDMKRYKNKKEARLILRFFEEQG
nr:MAG TPA: hypothetical protein [Caudoviricetes sp.]